MAVLISGSLAYDTVFDHRDAFSDTLIKAELSVLNVTFQAADMRRTIGGCAGNIAYALKQLGGDPLIWTAVGCDADVLLEHLRANDIGTEGITVCPDTYSAQAIITTDKNGCQLTTFYSGAMAYADKIPFPQSDVSLAILAPTTHDPLLAHAAALQSRGIPYLLDTGQTTPLFSGEELITLSQEAEGVCFSQYESELYREKTGMTPEALSRLTGRDGTSPVIYCTLGAEGSMVYRQGVATHVPAHPTTCVDPVGAGDAYRGGLLWGLSQGYSPIVAARVGALIAAKKVSVAGPSYRYSELDARSDYLAFFGETLP